MGADDQSYHTPDSSQDHAVEINQTFRLRYEFGQFYIQDSSGNFVDLAAFDAIAEALARTRNYLRSTGMTQQEIYKKILSDDELLKHAKIEYPFDHPFAVRRNMGEGSRTQKTPRFSGVYVLTLKQQDDAVKIGLTIDLYARSKELKHSAHPHVEGDPVFLPVAFIHTEHHQIIESFLHKKFAAHRLNQREWFDRAPVEEWLQQFRSES